MDEISLTVFQCPVCGGVLDFGDGEETSCKSCGNKVHKFKTKTEVNLKVEYALISDGSKFVDRSDVTAEDLFSPNENTVRDVTSTVTGADIVKINGHIKQLVWNYSSPLSMKSAEREECGRLLKEIEKADPKNIYAMFLRRIAFAESVNPLDTEEILTRSDSLEISGYILPVLREMQYQGLKNAEHFVNYIVHCSVSEEEKYNNIMAVLTSKYLVIGSLEEVKPILVDILGLKIGRDKRYKLLTLLYTSIASGDELRFEDGFSGFVRYIVLSDLSDDQKYALIGNLIKFNLGHAQSFDQAVQLLDVLRATELPEHYKAKLLSAALAKCTPKNMSFEGYFNLSGYISDHVSRFKYLFYLFLSSYNSIFFKLETALLFYYQHSLSADEMLLLLDMSRVFAEDNVVSGRVAELKGEVEKKKAELQLTSGYSNTLLADAEIGEFFRFLVRYEKTKPVMTVSRLGSGLQYSEETERALYAMTGLRYYYHKIYDCGIVAPYRTLDAVDGAVAKLSALKNDYIKAGNTPYDVSEVKRKADKKVPGDALIQVLAVLFAILVGCSALMGFLFNMDTFLALCLAIVIFGVVYSVAVAGLRYLFKVRRKSK